MNVFVSCLSAEYSTEKLCFAKKRNPVFASLPFLQEGNRCAGDRLVTGLKDETGDDPDVALCLCLYHSDRGASRRSDRESQVFDSSYKKGGEIGFCFQGRKILNFFFRQALPGKGFRADAFELYSKLCLTLK